MSDVLERYELPAGLFPQNYRTYRLKALPHDEGEKLDIKMPFVLEVSFAEGTRLRFDKHVSCCISSKEITEVNGIKYLSSSWSKVKFIQVESTSKIAFHTRVRKAKKLPYFEELHQGIRVSTF